MPPREIRDQGVQQGEEGVHSLPVSVVTLLHFLRSSRSTSDIIKYPAPRGRHGQVAPPCVSEKTRHDKHECTAKADDAY